MQRSQNRDIEAGIKARMHPCGRRAKCTRCTNTDLFRLRLNLMPERSISHQYEVHIIHGVRNPTSRVDEEAMALLISQLGDHANDHHIRLKSKFMAKSS